MKTSLYVERLKGREAELIAEKTKAGAKYEKALAAWVPRFAAHLRSVAGSREQVEEVARGRWKCWSETALFKKAPAPPEKPDFGLLGRIRHRLLYLGSTSPSKINPPEREIFEFFGATEE